MFRSQWLRGTINAGLDRLTVWVDAICIDQSNLVERSEQVMLMDRVYSNCSGFLVWLGDATEFEEEQVKDALSTPDEVHAHFHIVHPIQRR
jgi:hypothetical protein